MRNLTLVLLCFCSSGVLAQDLPNLLRNPSFEALGEGGWATDWVIWPHPPPEPGAVTVDTGVAHSGGNSLRLRHHHLGSYSRAQQVLPVEPHQKYYFTVWMKCQDVVAGAESQGARLYIEGLGGSDHASYALVGTSDWQQLKIGPVDSGNGGVITVMCYLHMATGTVWFDDVQAVKVTPGWEHAQQQRQVHRRLEVDLEQAMAAARLAGDLMAQEELTDLRERAAGADVPDRLNFRAGPPYFPLQAEIFAVMARLNARRTPGQGPLLAWSADPFAAVPALGLVPARRALALRAMAGIGEREQVALNLCYTGDLPLPLRVRWSGFGGSQPPAVTLREAVHVQSRLGQLLADPLPRLRPNAGTPGVYRMTLTPGLFRQLWLDIATDGTAPGQYRGTVTLQATGQPELEVPVTVRVLPVELPRELPIATWNYSYQTWKLLQGRWPQALADLQAHHINSYCWPSDTLPWPRFDNSGALQPLDWTRFDRALADHGPVQWLLLWPGFESEHNLRLRQDLKPGSELWEQRFIAWFQALIAGLQDRGLGPDRIAWYLADEPCNRERAEAVRLTGAAVHKADPRALVTANPYYAATQDLLDLMAPVVDIWCPSLPWATGDLLFWFQSRSKILWSYQVLPRDADAFGAYRLSFWECWHKGMTGQGFWNYADGEGDNWTETIDGRPGYAVVYGGDPDELIPSRRWEAWREGTEDYTYLAMLKQAGRLSATFEQRIATLLQNPSPGALQALRNELLLALARQ
ncbi:MAG: DUF4091 domain-containing protein [Armatimonadetes bacterium]|nr:DUF4091 domain-containing protein [Armatimonadota bacterium]